MLGLTLRKEFQGRRLKGTAIELANSTNTGATQISASEFLEITYPSADALQALGAVSPDQDRPLVLIGDRGQGKSHLMAMLHHAFTDSTATSRWLHEWGPRLNLPELASIRFRGDLHVISESLHRHNYKFLWDLLFDRHPHGPEIRGMWTGLGQNKTQVPSYELLVELFRRSPTALLFDEFQTWFDGLTNTRQHPWRNWAFNCIQLLSEIAKEHPELLVLVVSVRDGSSDAFQQIQRIAPVLVDFKGPTAKEDRQHLLLHRLFENRTHIANSQIESILHLHVSEYLRLLKPAPSEHDRIRRRFVESWPFAPHLLQLLEDQVLVATHAQETRDLIRILADLFKQNVDSPVLTAADFRLSDDRSGVIALLDSVANQNHMRLRQKAQRNQSAVIEAVPDSNKRVPNLDRIIAALWLRTLAIENMAGAEPEVLQVDITRDHPIDDNHFEAELSIIEENSFNIHRDGRRLIFKDEENPQSKLIANARNDKIFSDGSDIDRLIREIHDAIGGRAGVSQSHHVVVLPPTWSKTPWEAASSNGSPHNWGNRVPLLVLPESPEPVGGTLGHWLREQLQSQRNAVRFLLPKKGSAGVFFDREVLVVTRAVVLADRWRQQNPEYQWLLTKYQRELEGILANRFDRFAILDTWNFQEPGRCTFHISAHKSSGQDIPEAISEHVRVNLFVPEEFDALAIRASHRNESIGNFLRELREPRPSGHHCIPWLGEDLLKEHVVRVCARGDIAIDIRGMEYLQLQPGEDERSAQKRMQGKLGTGKHLNETYLIRPQAVPRSEDVEGQAESGGKRRESPGGDEEQTKTSEPSGETECTSTGESNSNETTGSPVALVLHTSDAMSALNLLARVETWGITTETQILDVSINIPSATGAQLNEFLRSLPDGIQYELRLRKERH